MEQAQLELQLKVWKELAISKQVLMRAATDALKLDPNCTQEELKDALEAALKKLAEADASVATAREQARQSVTTTERKLATTEQALAAAQASVAQLQATQENTLKEIAIERSVSTRELQVLKDRVMEKDKAIKAINVALADTPENVIKKMKAFKKEKQEESDLRRQLEVTINTLRKEKKEVDQKVTELTERSTKLETQYRETHALCVKLHEQLKPLVTDAKDLPEVPALDGKLLGEIDEDDSKADAKSKKKKK